MIHQSDFEVHISDSDLSQRFRSRNRSSYHFDFILRFRSKFISLRFRFKSEFISLRFRFRSRFRSQLFRSVSVIHISKSKSKFISAIQIEIQLGDSEIQISLNDSHRLFIRVISKFSLEIEIEVNLSDSERVVLMEINEEDKTVGEALNTISRGVHDKGHSVTMKRTSDGKVDTMQTLHNLNEDELAGFEETWKANAQNLPPDWNSGFNLLENAAGLDFVIDAGVRVADPSTVVDMIGSFPRIIRQGKGQNEEDLSYMFDETTPVKACGDLAYHVADNVNMDKELQQCTEMSSQVKRRRMLQFDNEILGSPLCNEEISSVFLKSKEREDSLEEALSDMSHWVSGFEEETSATGHEGLDQSSEGWLADCFNNVRDLVEASNMYGTLNNVLDVDVKNDTVRTQGSLSCNLRRVRQGLDLIRAIFENFLSSDMGALNDHLLPFNEEPSVNDSTLKSKGSTSSADTPQHGHVLQDCVMTALEKKTVILVTYQVEFLSQVIEGGEITQSGSYKELLMIGTLLVTSLLDTIITKAPKKPSLVLRMIVLTFAMLCGLYICSICLKQISTRTNFGLLNVQVIQRPCEPPIIETWEKLYVHYPQPKTFSRDECKCNPVRYFAIISTQRSGSGWFETLLNSHINISSNGEIFSVKVRRSNISTIVETLDKIYNLDWLTSASKNECTAAVGLKWMLNQGLMQHHEEIVEYFNTKGVSLIFLFRRNLLRRMISILSNSYDQNAKPLNGTQISCAAEILASYKPTIDTTLLIRNLRQVEEMTAKALEYFKSTQHIILYYEDIIKNSTKLKDVQDFLRVPQRDLKSQQVKIHKGSLSQHVENWDDIQRALYGTPYESFLHSDYNM
ncbi:unnamed protein product [Camellia sinensis]